MLITHNHFDHLDGGTVRALPAEVPVVAPAGLGRWLRARGRSAVVELEWWESAEIDGLVVTLVQARHWSRRSVLGTKARCGEATSSSSGSSASTTPATPPGSKASPRSAAASPVCWPRWCRSAASGDPKPVHGGLTEFGEKVVAEMNRLGMIIDVSHAGDETFWDVLKLSKAPVVASHSACRALSPHHRN